MTITLEAIEAEQSRINKLIDEFRKQPTRATELHIPAVTIPLAPGERYAGIVLDENGELSHHLILLPGDVDDVSWSAAKEWAAEQGGELPTRREQSLLFANLKSEFEERAYWSAEAHESESGWAWCQHFRDGHQYYTPQHYEFRARAVRRFIPSRAEV
ncbi:DUF1566 domain-containing protein [Paraburkholderia antibiotica]|uniref:DUF1566 domain-containing protein n=1 Tax=Paraburkholderia antibiotica TaxID=2728839 RepID=A0A7Y0FG75_9BURK|nr:DUF1566 domain-containing protein [Paraburkholderia antibiotica]NML34891.1 DUF1566 domain-containing protein [Paraburkholderia antibiotica]